MCGIAGLYRPAGEVDDAVARTMQNLLRHRGPDDEGNHVRPGLSLAMRRLAIIDRSGGHQPISDETGAVTVIYNGEIYNHHALRRELESRGHRFRTRTDTEVIVHLYEEEGEACVRRFDGMFAFALWDERRARLLLARDRFGVKPLFYARTGDRLAWASEIKALLAVPEVTRALDPEALDTYLALYYIPTPRTIYRDIRSLPPAHYLTASTDGVHLRRYWTPRFDGCRLAGRALDEAIRERIRAAVASTLEAEVPLGVFLSGGLDSTMIAACAARERPGLASFSLGFEGDPSYDERGLARLVAERYGTDHHEIVFRPEDLVEILPRLVDVYGQPFGDWSAALNDRLAREAATVVTVALRGDGGDELLGGYPTLIASRHAALYLGLPDRLRRMLRRAVEALPAGESYLAFDFLLKRFVAGVRRPVEAAHLAWKEIFNAEERRNLCPLLPPDRPDILCTLARSWCEEVGEADLLHRLMYLDLRVFLEGCGLITSDHVAMAHSIETRVPLLTNDFADFALSLPPRAKVRGLTTKYAYRRALAPLLPIAVRRAPKRGFVLPGAAWLRGPLRSFTADILEEAPDMLDRRMVRRIWESHLSRRRDETRRLTALINFSLWARRYGI